MGTNYYVEGKHVGKVSGNGAGRGYRFTWAMPPREFLELARQHERTHPETSDGYGECSMCEVVSAITHASSEEFDSIGQEFC